MPGVHIAFGNPYGAHTGATWWSVHAHRRGRHRIRHLGGRRADHEPRPVSDRMIPAHRHRFNREYTDERYDAYIRAVEARVGMPVPFTLCETPCFLPASLVDRLVVEAQAMLAELFANRDYLHAADAVVPASLRLGSGEARPTCIQVDFGLVRTGDGIEGRLVELQAFPSLYGLQMVMGETSRDHYNMPALTPYIGGISHEEYVDAVRRALVGDHDPAEVVLVEIDPQHQKTRPDFAATEHFWGVRDRRSVRARAGRPSRVRAPGRQAAADRAHLQPRDSRRAGPQGTVLPLRRHRGARRRMGGRTGLVLPAEQVRDSVARAPVGAAHVLPARSAVTAGRSRALAAQAAVLVRRRRHHLRADRRATRRDSG